jgi:hypothetical protein
MSGQEEQETKTSEQSWLEMFERLVQQGSLAIVWHEGRGCCREDFDTVVQLQGGSTIQQRTYQKGKVIPDSMVERIEPGKMCFEDTWKREESTYRHWPYLDSLLDLLDGQGKIRERAAEKKTGQRFTSVVEKRGKS